MTTSVGLNTYLQLKTEEEKNNFLESYLFFFPEDKEFFNYFCNLFMTSSLSKDTERAKNYFTILCNENVTFSEGYGYFHSDKIIAQYKTFFPTLHKIIIQLLEKNDFCLERVSPYIEASLCQVSNDSEINSLVHLIQSFEFKDHYLWINKLFKSQFSKKQLRNLIDIVCLFAEYYPFQQSDFDLIWNNKHIISKKYLQAIMDGVARKLKHSNSVLLLLSDLIRKRRIDLSKSILSAFAKNAFLPAKTFVYESIKNQSLFTEITTYMMTIDEINALAPLFKQMTKEVWADVDIISQFFLSIENKNLQPYLPGKYQELKDQLKEILIGYYTKKIDLLGEFTVEAGVYLIELYGEEVKEVIYQHIYDANGNLKSELCSKLMQYNDPQNFGILLDSVNHYHDNYSLNLRTLLQTDHELILPLIPFFINFRPIQLEPITTYLLKNKINRFDNQLLDFVTYISIEGEQVDILMEYFYQTGHMERYFALEYDLNIIFEGGQYEKYLDYYFENVDDETIFDVLSQYDYQNYFEIEYLVKRLKNNLYKLDYPSLLNTFDGELYGKFLLAVLNHQPIQTDQILTYLFEHWPYSKICASVNADILESVKKYLIQYLSTKNIYLLDWILFQLSLNSISEKTILDILVTLLNDQNNERNELIFKIFKRSPLTQYKMIGWKLLWSHTNSESRVPLTGGSV